MVTRESRSAGSDRWKNLEELGRAARTGTAPVESPGGPGGPGTGDPGGPGGPGGPPGWRPPDERVRWRRRGLLKLGVVVLVVALAAVGGLVGYGFHTATTLLGKS